MNTPNITPEMDKSAVLDEVERYTRELGLTITDEDRQRPWGGFFVIAPESTNAFIETFFPEVDREDIYRYGSELGPKILVVQPGEQLSWQYHHRRAELWKAIAGPVGVLISKTDEKPDAHLVLNPGELTQHDTEVRHRLIGLENWGVLAEIWQHSDPNQPSDESDIVRLEDNYGRN